MKKTLIYKPKYEFEEVNYQREIRNSGQEIEIVCFYKTDKHMFSNPPNHTKLIDKLLKLLKGTGISKITITHLDKNLYWQRKRQKSKS